MSWTHFARRYVLQFEGGYRYLDHCGEFMAEAEEALDLIPSEDAKPTGARLEKPEAGITVTLDANQLAAVQEFGGEADEPFVALCEPLAALAIKHIEPRALRSQMFRLLSFMPMGSVEEAMRYVLQVGNEHQTELGRALQMTPSHKKIDYVFTSGNVDVNVVLSATTFESVTERRLAAGVRASAWQKKRIERVNHAADRLQLPTKHVAMLEIGATEYDPPAGNLPELFGRLKKLEMLARCGGSRGCSEEGGVWRWERVV